MEDDDVTVIQPREEDAGGKTTCMVCYNIYHSKKRVPKILPCGHSFCQECIAGIINNRRGDQGSFGCPTCRKKFKVDSKNPSQTVAAVPTNFVLRELLEKYETIEDNPQLSFLACFHCRKECHEKDMLFCDTCASGETSEHSLDFMGRPKLRLMCFGCMALNHPGHSYESQSVVAGRWKHRSFFQKFEKSAKEETERIQKFITTTMKTLDGALKYKDNLQVTIRQLKSNAGTRGIGGILRNFVRAADDSSKYVDMSTELMERFSCDNAPHQNLLGKKLFNFSKNNRRAANFLGYESELSNLFDSFKAKSAINHSIIIEKEFRGGRPRNDTPAASPLRQAVSPELAPVLQLPQAPVGQPEPQPQALIMHNPQPFHGAMLGNLQPVVNPPVRPINQEELNVILNYYIHMATQQQANYAGMMIFDAAPNAYDLLRQARHRAFNVAAQFAQNQMHQGPVLRPDTPVTLRTFYQLPFHLFNAYLPQLYHETVQGVIVLFVSRIPLDGGGAEVHDFFFVPPYENRQFTVLGRQQIRGVLTDMMTLLIPGEMLYSHFERLKAVIDEVGQGHEGMANVGVPFMNQPILPQNQAEEEVIVIQNGDDQPGPNGVDAEELERNDNIVPNQEAEMPDAGEPHDDVVLDNHENPVREEALQRNEEELYNEEIERFQREPRVNYTFQMEDLVIEPPARATRAAKRRADAVFVPENLVAPNLAKTRPSVSNVGHARRAPSARVRKRTRNA